MLGLNKGRSPITASRTNLNNLRRSVAWAGEPKTSSVANSEVLSDRLRSLLVLELLKDGDERRYLNLSVRELYRHVLTSITGSKARAATPLADVSPRSRRGTVAQTSSTSLPLLESLATELPRTHPAADEETGPPPEELKPPRVTFLDPALPPSIKPLPSLRKRRSTSIGGDHVTYRERLGGYLHPRDMRRLVTPFSATNEPELMVRRHVMLLNFDPLRAIVLRDRLLVLVPDGADSVLVLLENRVRGDVEENIFGGASTSVTTDPSSRSVTQKISDSLSKAGEIFKRKGSRDDLTQQETDSAPSSSQHELMDQDSEDDDMENEWNEMTGHEWVGLPFELQCADAVLHVVGNILTEDTFELQTALEGYILRLLSDHGGLLSDDPLTIIRAVKIGLNEMSSRVKGFMDSLNRVLNEDEDMALMNLSRLLTNPERFIQPVSPEVLEEESDEPELILEAHLQTALTLTNAIDLMTGQIDSAAALVDQKLDAVRNRLLFANMVISILSLCVASASLVGSIFGMNLRNFMEDDPNAFRQVTYGTLAGSIVLALFIMFLLSFSGTIPRAGRTVGL